MQFPNPLAPLETRGLDISFESNFKDSEGETKDLAYPVTIATATLPSKQNFLKVGRLGRTRWRRRPCAS
jgi:hypothetical protein